MTAISYPIREKSPLLRRSFKARAFEFFIESDTPERDALIEHLFSGFAREATTSVPTDEMTHRFHSTTYTLESGLDGTGCELLRDGRRIGESSVAWAIDWILSDLTTRVVELESRSLLIHAGAVSGPGGALIIAGPPGCGKSTLVAALTAEGLSYLSDEVAALDLETHVVSAFPRPMAIRADSFDLVSELAELRPTDLERGPGSPKVHLNPEDLRPGSNAATAPVAAVIVPVLDGSGRAVLEPLSRAELVMLVAEQSFNFRSLGERALVGLGSMVESCRGYRLHLGDLGEAIRLLTDLLERDDGPSDTPGEHVAMVERLIVAPIRGRFYPLIDTGEQVEVGSVVGWMANGGPDHPVRSGSVGALADWLVWPGEIVQTGGRVAVVSPFYDTDEQRPG